MSKKITKAGQDFRDRMSQIKHGQPISLRSIGIEPTYQRILSKPNIKRIKENQKDGIVVEALRPLLVAQRDDDTHWVVDGQHSYAALKQLGVESFFADIFPSPGPAFEAMVFRITNANRKNVTPVQMFNAMFAEGDHQSIAIARILAKFNLLIGSDVKAVRAIQRIYEMDHGAILTDTITCISEGWEGFNDNMKFKEVCLIGCAKLIEKLFTNDMWSTQAKDELVVKMQATNCSPMTVLANYAVNKNRSGWKRPQAAYESFAPIWNHARRVNRLKL